MLSELEQSIINTISYFDLFNFPLTVWEINKNLYNPIKQYSLEQIDQALNSLKEKTLDEKEGFYFIKGKANLVSTRKSKYLLAKKKIQRAKKHIWLISRLPFVKSIFICNNLAYQNAPWESDVDLAIVSTKNRIWTTRLLSTMLMKLLNKRPNDKTHQNKICLSVYLTENNLNLKNIAYQDDIHLVYWINQFMPIYDEVFLIKKFFKENDWTKKYLPNTFSVKTNNYWFIRRKAYFKKPMEFIFSGFLGNWMESLLKKFQLKIMPKQIKQLAKENNTNVILSDKILKFHTKDQRLAVLERWQDSTSTLL